MYSYYGYKGSYHGYKAKGRLLPLLAYSLVTNRVTRYTLGDIELKTHHSIIYSERTAGIVSIVDNNTVDSGSGLEPSLPPVPFSCTSFSVGTGQSPIMTVRVTVNSWVT